MSNNSSVPVNELLKQPLSVKLDNKDFKLQVTSSITASSYISRFPSNVLPKFVNSCTKNVSGSVYEDSISQRFRESPSNTSKDPVNNTSQEFIYKESTKETVNSVTEEPLGRNTYKLERIWFINSKNQVWETSKLEFNKNTNNFTIQEYAPDFGSDISLFVVIKLSYKGASYFIRSKFMDN